MNIELVDKDIQNAEAFSFTGMQRVSSEQLRYDQQADRDVRRVVAHNMKVQRPTKLERRGEIEGTRVLMLEGTDSHWVKTRSYKEAKETNFSLCYHRSITV